MSTRLDSGGVFNTNHDDCGSDNSGYRCYDSKRKLLPLDGQKLRYYDAYNNYCGIE
jgi:hypothetical protein